MKKYLILLFAVISFSLASCEKDTEPGGTAVEKMAGTWYVTWEVKNDQGVWEDILGGTVELNTYNTSANISTEMWLNESYVTSAPLKVTTDYKSRAFSLPAETEISPNGNNMIEAIWGEAITVTITDGKVLEKAATTPSGMPADSIIFFLNVKGDDTYKIAGFRRTGFPEDE